MDKCCCNRKMCPHYAENDDSSQNSATWEGVDKATQMSPKQDTSPACSDKNELSVPLNAAGRDNQISSHPELSSASSGKTVLPAKTTKKSSQTHFNRNNENINSHQNKLYPSNTSQTSQLDSTLSSDMIKYTPMAATTTASPHLCIKCMQMPKPIQHTTTTSSSLQMTSNTHKCTCQNLATSSSSQCTIPENFPIQLKLNFKPMEKISEPNIRRYNPQVKSPGQQQIILVPKIIPRPERLQPYPSVTSQEFLTPNSLTITDDYYSCTSEESECDMNRNAEVPLKITEKLPKNLKGAEKNLVILQLLHEVVHLIQEDNPIREEVVRIIQDDHTRRGHITTQTKETVCVPLNQSETSKTQSSAKTISKTAMGERIPKRDQKEPGDFNPGQLQPPPQLAWPTWTPCYCYLHGMTAAQNRAMPYPIDMGTAQGQPIPLTVPIDSTAPLPHNFIPPFPCISELLQDFVYQETEVAYDECSCDENEQITLVQAETDGIQLYKETEYEQKNKDVVKCICPKLTDVCPKHGPLENLLKESSPSYPKAEIFELKTSITEEDQAICICQTEENKCPVHSREIKQKLDNTEEVVDKEFYPPSVNNNNVPTSNYITLQDEEHSKPIRLSQENEVNELHPHYAKKTANDSFDNNVPNPNHDDLKDYENQVMTVEDKVSSKQPRAELEDQINQLTVYHDETTVHHELPQVDQVVEPIEKSPYIVRTSATTQRNIYNFLPALDRGEIEDVYYEQVGRHELAELDSADDYYYPDYECEELDEECELAKEKNAERRKKKKRDKRDDVKKVPPKSIENISIAVATLQQLEGEGSPEEMKFFIDSLILDLDAMEHARRKTAIEKNICMPRPGMCPRESFPVTITDVADLGTTSLYVKWIIHDCCGIGGYEIYTDGYLTNCYFHCKHEAAVITNVDVTLPHKIALVAQTTTDDASIEFMCNRAKSKNKCKCLPWKTDFEKDKESSPSIISALWTPSIYLYDPVTCRATAAPPIMRGSI